MDANASSTSAPAIAAFPEALLAYRVAMIRRERPALAVISGSDVEGLRRFARHLRFFDPATETIFVSRRSMPSGWVIPVDDRREFFRALTILAEPKPATILIPRTVLPTPLPPISRYRTGALRLKSGDELEPSMLIDALGSAGYERVPTVRSEGTFAVRGSLVDLFVPTEDFPFRLDFDDVRLSQIRTFDPQTQGSMSELPEIVIPPHTLSSLDRLAECSAAADRDGTVMPAEPVSSFSEWITGHRLFHLEDEQPGAGRASPHETTLSLFPAEGAGERLEEPAMPPGIVSQAGEIQKLIATGWRVVLGLPADLSRRVIEFLKERNLSIQKRPPGSFSLDLSPGLWIVEGDLPSGLRDAGRKILLLAAPDLFPRRRNLEVPGDAPPAPIRGYAARSISDVLELSDGDYVVHEQYGIGIYRGLKRIRTREEESEYLAIEYRDKDLLYVPLDKFHMVQKYIGSGRKPKPHRLGDAAWQKIKRSAREKIEVFARDLLGLYASREHRSGFAFSADTIYQKEFEMRFPFDETPDQIKVIAEVKLDMEAPKPMDRLICGDAGFGKTEVALRAAFKATMDGKQVSIVVPTTLLAEQHRQVFEERFAGFSTQIAELSRFRTRAEQQEILDKLRSGEIDICIGTHRLLQEDVVFKDLGFLIIDEEHRFGVRQKEKLKFYRQFVDVISMSATPIPRTLYMSLIGTRDISLIETPPRNRAAIHTEIYPYHPRLIREASVREIARGGQVFFLYNRVETIHRAAEWIRKAVPEARIGVSHGQMTEDELAAVMDGFYHKRIDILVTTTIIESGLDLPNANTIFIFDAERFGLSTLYQLRGRVGRSDRSAYCYLLTPEGRGPLTASARRRLEAIAAITGVGGGYRVALEDLTLRGAGNLLGREQHGVVWEIGFEMYCEMLKDALIELKGEMVRPPWNVKVDVKIPQYIPEDRMVNPAERIAIYRRIAKCRTRKELREVSDSLRDRLGDFPPSLENLFMIRLLKLLAEDFQITEIIEWNKSLSVYTDSPSAVVGLTSRLRPVQATPRRLEYNLRGMTAEAFVHKLAAALAADGA